MLLLIAAAFFAARMFRGNEASRPKRDIDPGRPMVALTFDDGPCAGASDRILDVLEANGAVATFFEVGSNVERYPEITARADSLGCEIGSHTYAHIDLPSSDEDLLKADRTLCEQAFRNAMGYVPIIMRPPGGALNGTVKLFYDYPFFGWSVDTEDWKTRNSEDTVERIKAFGNLDGQVVLMHSIYDSTADAVQQIVPWLLEQGYQLVTVSELMENRYGTVPEEHVYYTVDYFLYGMEAN